MPSQTAALAAGLVALVLLLLGARGRAAGDRLTIAEVRALARQVTSTWFPGVDPLMLRAMAEIESARDPKAFRAEPHVGDASIGLMQTLQGTAQWLWDAMGYRALPRPDLASLTDPLTSMYFGAAMVDWLSTYAGRARSEEFIVRAYNGGPGGADAAATEGHWQRYLAAKARLQSGE